MGLAASINVHLEQAPVQAVVREIGRHAIVLTITARDGDYGDVSLFFRTSEKERAEKVAALINEMVSNEESRP